MISQIILSLLFQQAAAQLGDILSYKYQRYTECSSLLQTCQPTISTCADYVCAQCTDLGQSILNNCCSQAVPVQCFIAGAGSGSGNGGGGGGGGYITSVAPDPNLSACSTALNAITTCESLTPGFSTLPNSDEASCLCYDGSAATPAWDPAGFDGPWSSCVAWASTADTTAYSELLANAGLCASVGNILSAAPASGASAQTTVAGGGSGQSVTPAVTPAATMAPPSSTSGAVKATSSSAGSSLAGNFKGVVVVKVILGLGFTLVL